MPAPSTTGAGLMAYPTSVDPGGVPPLILSNEPGGETSNTGTLSASIVYLYAFELQTSVIVTKMRYHNGSTTTGTTNLGLYTFAGNLVSGSDTGAITNVANTTQTFTYGTSITLAPGQYFLALSCSNGTDSFQVLAPAATDCSRQRRATNTLSGGALPSTTGSITTSSVAPAVAALVSGGLS